MAEMHLFLCFGTDVIQTAEFAGNKTIRGLGPKLRPQSMHGLFGWTRSFVYKQKSKASDL